jgi:heme-degrading monooxygenase HmoA
MVIVVTNRLSVNDAYTVDFEDRFQKRVHLVDQSPGFIRNEVHRPRPMRFVRETGDWIPDPEKSGCYEVKTWWKSMEDFVAWTRSESFRSAHADRPPKEMFSGPSEITVHEILTSTDLIPVKSGA